VTVVQEPDHAVNPWTAQFGKGSISPSDVRPPAR
jgi:hypothetical protein